MFLLDTNVWVAFLRKPHSPVVARLQARSPAEIRVCSVVVAELYYGCLRSARPADNRAKVDALIAPYSSLPFDLGTLVLAPLSRLCEGRSREDGLHWALVRHLV